MTAPDAPSPSGSMTPEAKRALSRTIRQLRERLLDELDAATESAYRLGIPAKDARLSEAARIRRERLEGWIAEQVRALPKAERATAGARFRAEVVKDAAATLLNRIVYLRLLEAAGLRVEKVVTGGWASRGYKDFREFAAELVRGDESEGYDHLLGLIFDDLAMELPGLFGDVRLTGLIPIPAATLRAVVEALDAPELESCWGDDTTFGWVYQYWNDPEREALDKKIGPDRQKLENDEIAAKTQMFTERYMVEWLLQNTLGQTWLAMCRKHGWTADVEADGTLDRLEERRADWRAKRDAGEVALDALMPLETDGERRWAYWVPQPMPADAPGYAPERLRDLKLLDPACGSGHFLVIACDLLFALYREEARHHGEEISDRAVVESILERNLHSVDIDPRAVQIAAAALMLKAKQLAPDAAPRRLNLVAPQLRLAGLPADDPARVALRESVEGEAGIPGHLTEQIVDALAGADHLGTLLQVDRAIDEAIHACEAELSRPESKQGQLFEEDRRAAPRVGVDAAEARATLLDRLRVFLDAHSSGDDLGLKLRGEQLSAGLRFVELVQEGRYDIVVGNPPYQGTSKMADASYVAKHYPRGKADLYAAFLERGLQLVREGGVSALVTMRNWMFTQQYSDLRCWLIEHHDLRALGDVDRGAFEEVLDEVVAVTMSVVRAERSTNDSSVALQPTPASDNSRDAGRTQRKRAALLCQLGRFIYDQVILQRIPAAPLVYWWSKSFASWYATAPKLKDVAPAKAGSQTSDDIRFLRRSWEPAIDQVWASRTPDEPPLRAEWAPCIKGAAGRRWQEPLSDVIRWRSAALELRTFSRAYPRNTDLWFKIGVAFPKIDQTFYARAHRFRSICGDAGPSVFPSNTSQVLCLLNSAVARFILESLSPTLNKTSGDVDQLPYTVVADAGRVYARIEAAFTTHESRRESSIEFNSPGPSPWRYAQDWAQRAVDRPEGEPLPPYEPEYDAEPPIDHLSFAVGVALGRFGAGGEGILDEAPADALPHGILFLSEASDERSPTDSLAHPAAKRVLRAWEEHGAAIDPKRGLGEYLRTQLFADDHKKRYENRPIYFPLSSEKKSFVAWVSIHSWNESTLRALLAEHLKPALTRIEGEIADLRAARAGADKKAAREAEGRYTQLDRWKAELETFIQNIEQCAEKGPPRPDAKTPEREVDARYAPDLDDGVMINSAALWPLLEPQWKDPRKWWKELASAKGKKDYDWSHLAARHFPARVDAKCRKDPSLAVAHGCFWRYHPALAYKWELRLQDEIGPDFTLDEEGSDAARAAFEQAHPDQVEELRQAEQKRRDRKRKKAAEAEQAATTPRDDFEGWARHDD